MKFVAELGKVRQLDNQDYDQCDVCGIYYPMDSGTFSDDFPNKRKTRVECKECYLKRIEVQKTICKSRIVVEKSKEHMDADRTARDLNAAMAHGVKATALIKVMQELPQDAIVCINIANDAIVANTRFLNKPRRIDINGNALLDVYTIWYIETIYRDTSEGEL
jgi:hypothetical protein